MEVHNEAELENNLNEHLDVVGVNNRNLKTFETTIETSKALVDKIPNEFVKISESGISDPETIIDLKACGFQGFLIGETFMKSSRPERAAAEFIESVNRKLVNG